MSSPSSAGDASPELGGAVPDGHGEGQAHAHGPPSQGNGRETEIPNEVPPQNVEEAELGGSFFPSPPHYYKRYTAENLALPIDHPEPFSVAGEAGTTFLRKDLEPPRVDWMLEHGSYSVFGQTWPVEEKLPSLSETGVRELYDPTQNRVNSLQDLLKALLLSYSSLVSSLLLPPPSLVSTSTATDSSAEAHETQLTDPERLVEHIRLISINMHHLVNELRPVQARETLKNMMKAQISTRRAKTVALQEKCTELTATLTKLKADLSHFQTLATDSETPTNGLQEVNHLANDSTSTDNDVEEIKRIQLKLKQAVDSL